MTSVSRTMTRRRCGARGGARRGGRRTRGSAGAADHRVRPERLGTARAAPTNPRRRTGGRDKRGAACVAVRAHPFSEASMSRRRPRAGRAIERATRRGVAVDAAPADAGVGRAPTRMTRRARDESAAVGNHVSLK